jgi:lycopene cyclase domain-containing protein
MGIEYLAVTLGVLMVCILVDAYLKTEILTKKRRAFGITYVIGILLMSWDGFATTRGHWWYGEKFMLGISIFNAPVENFVLLAVFILISIIAWEYFGRKT